jgi:hypothetical protein
MYTVAKSMFTNKTIVTNTRSIKNPISDDSLIPVIVNPINNIQFQITQADLGQFQEIETYYGSNLKNKTYMDIPTRYQTYVDLFVYMENLLENTTDANTIIILKLIQEALVGAINAFTLYGQTTYLQIDNTNLQNTITTILSNKNDKKIAAQPANSGQMTITKTFTLAAVFNYYIVIFGMPAYGVGFDPDRIYFLTNILKNMGIDPYK